IDDRMDSTDRRPLTDTSSSSALAWIGKRFEVTTPWHSLTSNEDFQLQFGATTAPSPSSSSSLASSRTATHAIASTPAATLRSLVSAPPRRAFTIARTAVAANTVPPAPLAELEVSTVDLLSQEPPVFLFSHAF